VPDFEPNGFQFTAQLVVPEAKHHDALFGEELISFLIPGPLVWKTVSATVEFDGELRNGAVEIRKVDAACVLAAEFEFIETALARQAPQAFFGVGRFFAELAGEVAGGIGAGAVFAVSR
jgi:hypothetical protein